MMKNTKLTKNDHFNKIILKSISPPRNWKKNPNFKGTKIKPCLPRDLRGFHVSLHKRREHRERERQRENWKFRAYNGVFASRESEKKLRREMKQLLTWDRWQGIKDGHVILWSDLDTWPIMGCWQEACMVSLINSWHMANSGKSDQDWWKWSLLCVLDGGMFSLLGW